MGKYCLQIVILNFYKSDNKSRIYLFIYLFIYF